MINQTNHSNNQAHTCCGRPVKTGKRAQRDGTTVYAYWCETCGRKGAGNTPSEAIAEFDKSQSTSPIVNTIVPNRPTRTLKSASDLVAYIAERSSEIAQIAAPFIKADRPAFNLMVKKTTRYVMGLSGDAWAKVWATPEGRDSIIAAMEEAFQLGATLPDMGCLVPYGGIAEFIPDVEAYRFAVTTGASAPFESLEIVPVFKGDKYHTERDKDGNFSITFESMLAERNEVIAIAVYGRHRSGIVIGELYSVNRLIEKAKAHSQSYRTYLQDVAAFEAARAEGKLKRQDGREYVELTKEYYDKETHQKKSYIKRAYFDELTNPYDGPDRPEMLRKLAGKSFLAPYIKTRNSTAAINEIQETDDVSAMLDSALDQALDAVPADRTSESEQNRPAVILEPEEDLTPPPFTEPLEKPEPIERKNQTTKEEQNILEEEENELF